MVNYGSRKKIEKSYDRGRRMQKKEEENANFLSGHVKGCVMAVMLEYPLEAKKYRPALEENAHSFFLTRLRK